MTSSRKGPLQDLTIIDCTRALAGPFGAGLLADLGANVIKIEPPMGEMAIVTYRLFYLIMPPRSLKRLVLPILELPLPRLIGTKEVCASI